MSVPRSLALEEIAHTSANYLENLVDGDGLPYFNVFWTSPPCAAHDWPDYGDVMSRQYQGAVMLRVMTGRKLAIEDRWRELLLQGIDPSDGQLYRPARPWCRGIIEDAALPLYALATAAAADDDADLKRLAVRMAEGYLERLRTKTLRPDALFGGFGIKSLMVTARLLGSEAALDAARILCGFMVQNPRTFTPDNRFGPKAHVHGYLRSLNGMADYALTTGDAEIYSRVDALFRHVRSLSTRFGFLPEIVNWRPSDLIACEVCALMDYAVLGVTLANHGHPEYWDDVERLLRNHLLESQVRDASWLGAEGTQSDDAQFTWRDIARRCVGAWAGWSSPNHILAYRETLNAVWGGPELRDKIRALQNCCGGSGAHALFLLWRNAARCRDGVLSVHMHLDKLLPEAEIRCAQPYVGKTQVTLRRSVQVRFRIPDGVDRAALRLLVNGQPVEIPPEPTASGPFLVAAPASDAPVQTFGNYLYCGVRQAGDRLEFCYPLPEYTEEVAVGNAGHRQWHYRVTWKGSTVLAMDPLDNDVAECWSDFDKRQVQVFYGHEGPGRLYQRAHMRAAGLPEPAPLILDEGRLDFWRIR